MDIRASTRGALGTSDGGSKVILSTFPTRTPANRTSDPSRKPFASAKRAFKCSLRLKGLMSPDAFRMRKIRTAIEASTRSPTRTSLKPTVFFVLGITFVQGIKDDVQRSTFRLPLQDGQAKAWTLASSSPILPFSQCPRRNF